MSKRPRRPPQATSEENLAKAMAHIEEGRENKNKSLWLSNLRLTDLPESVKSLDELLGLYAQHNRLMNCQIGPFR